MLWEFLLTVFCLFVFCCCYVFLSCVLIYVQMSHYSCNANAKILHKNNTNFSSFILDVSSYTSSLSVSLLKVVFDLQSPVRLLGVLINYKQGLFILFPSWTEQTKPRNTLIVTTSIPPEIRTGYILNKGL